MGADQAAMDVEHLLIALDREVGEGTAFQQTDLCEPHVRRAMRSMYIHRGGDSYAIDPGIEGHVDVMVGIQACLERECRYGDHRGESNSTRKEREVRCTVIDARALGQESEKTTVHSERSMCLQRGK